MYLTTVKPKNSTEISALNWTKPIQQKLEITRHYSANLQTNKINANILSTFIYDKRISSVYNLLSTIIQFFLQ